MVSGREWTLPGWPAAGAKGGKGKGRWEEKQRMRVVMDYDS